MGGILEVMEPERSPLGGRSDEMSRGRFALAYVVPVLALLVISVWPLIEGSRTLFFRDVLNTHLEMKWVQAEAMKQGYLPLIDPFRGGGQPHLGNPNTVALYPDNLLYLVTEPFWAMNAHFWLHLLLAPLSFFWLGRAWGLSREASWTGGVVFVASGYVLSCLNLYNLIATVVWAPALAAAFIRVSAGGKVGRWLLASSVVWALLIVAGDPITAVLALVVAVSAVVARQGLKGPSWPRVALAVAFGTMLAAPMVLEFLRILSLSFRGHWGFSVQAATAGSWHPARVLDWFLPLAFGWPNLVFWGHRFHGGFPPLLFSLSPGLIAMALVAVGVGAGGRAVRWGGWLVVVGLFIALGRTNPLVSLLLHLPGAGMLRMPVKFWLLAAIGGSLLAAIGVERILEGRDTRLLVRVLSVLVGVFFLLWLGLHLAPGPVESMIKGWKPEALPDGLAAAERLRWRGIAMFSVLLAVATLLLARVGRSRVVVVVPLILALHLAAQLLLLRPLFESDEIAAYRQPSPAAAVIPEGAIVVHGTDGGLFEVEGVSPQYYPDASARWLHRQIFREFQPPAGIMAGRRYEFALTPEGLDSFLTRALHQAIVLREDPERIRILRASGVEWLLLRRELNREVLDAGFAELVLTFDSGAGEMHVYRLAGSADEVQFVGTLHPSANLNEALDRVLRPDFDPRTEGVLALDEGRGSGLDGTVEARKEEAEHFVWEVDARGSGALLIQRAHLPLYRATVDGEPVPIHVANLHRMAILLEPGRHLVELRVARSRFYAGLLTAALGLVLLLAAAWKGEAVWGRLRREQKGV